MRFRIGSTGTTALNRPGIAAPLPHRLSEARAEEVRKHDLGLEAASFRYALQRPGGGGKKTLRLFEPPLDKFRLNGMPVRLREAQIGKSRRDACVAYDVGHAYRFQCMFVKVDDDFSDQLRGGRHCRGRVALYNLCMRTDNRPAALF